MRRAVSISVKIFVKRMTATRDGATFHARSMQRNALHSHSDSGRSVSCQRTRALQRERSLLEGEMFQGTSAPRILTISVKLFVKRMTRSHIFTLEARCGTLRIIILTVGASYLANGHRFCGGNAPYWRAKCFKERAPGQKLCGGGSRVPDRGKHIHYKTSW